MPSTLASWRDHKGGHWGALGPRSAQPNQWGGVNMMLTRQGNLAPVSASRELTQSAASSGRVWGMFWGWGLDGRIYYVQQTAGTAAWTIKAFTPDPTAVPLATTTLSGTLTGPMVFEPDWVAVNETLYLTIWGDKVYAINPGANTYAELTGSYNDAPAGRCIALYGERLVIGGINDSGLGVHPNRVHFSGDDTNNDPADKTAWESLNYFDVGTDDTYITGLYPIRDGLVVILADQQIWTVTGIPGVNGSLRRAYGFHKGVSAISAFVSGHAVVDPSQTKVWLFNHAYRGPASFNGGAYQQLPNYGTPRSNREANDAVEGAVTVFGGPDEFLFHGVALPREAGAGVVNESLELVRINNSFSVVLRDVLAGT